MGAEHQVAPDAASMTACPHCGTWHDAESPDRCSIAARQVEMVADYVAAHPGCAHIDAAAGIGGPDIAKGYRARNEALAAGKIVELATTSGLRLFPAAEYARPGTLYPGTDHDVRLLAGQQVRTGNGMVAADCVERAFPVSYPLRGTCVCGNTATQDSPGGAWHHDPHPPMPRRYPQRAGHRHV